MSKPKILEFTLPKSCKFCQGPTTTHIGRRPDDTLYVVLTCLDGKTPDCPMGATARFTLKDWNKAFPDYKIPETLEN